MNRSIQYIQDALLKEYRGCEFRLHETVMKLYEKSQRLNHDESLLDTERLELKQELNLLQSQVAAIRIELNTWNKAWAISTSSLSQPQFFQVDRCVACGEIIPEGTQLCYRCRKIIKCSDE